MNFIKKIIGSFFAIMTITGIFTMSGLLETSEMDNTYNLLPTIFCAFITFLCFRPNKNKVNDSTLETSRHNNESRKYYFNHMSGLSAPQNSISSVELHCDYIKIICNGIEYSLSNEKITDISTKTETEITNFYSSSAGGAVAGALMFGVVGAAVGGRNKKKKISESKSYLVITYLKENDVNYIVFDVSNTFIDAMKFIREFDNYKVDHVVQIEL